MNKTAIKILVLLALVWGAVGVTVKWSRGVRATADSVADMIAENPLGDLPPGERREMIDQVAGEINALDFEQREALRKQRVDRIFFRQLTAEERLRFLDLTLPEGFRQLMLSLNKMTPEKRRKLVDRALRDIKEGDPDAPDPVERAETEKFVALGMEAFYSEANAEVKLDFAPVIERLQQATKGFR